MDNKKYIPANLRALTPMLAIRNAPHAIRWYQEIFNAKELYRLTDANNIIVHAELEIEHCIIMIAEENPEYNRSPESLGGTPVILNLYVSDPDKTVGLASKEGASIIFPVQDQFYGDRAGRIRDPFGHLWIVSKHIKDVSPEEMQKQMDDMTGEDS